MCRDEQRTSGLQLTAVLRAGEEDRGGGSSLAFSRIQSPMRTDPPAVNRNELWRLME